MPSYVPAPTDPAYYDAIAAGDNATLKGIVSGVQDVAAGAFTGYAAHQANKSAQADYEEKRRMARLLRDALVQEGVSQPMAEAAALEYARKGTQELMAAYQKRRELAAEIKVKEATAGSTEATTATEEAMRPGKIAQQGATLESTMTGTAQTQQETELMPRETAIRETTAGATAMNAESTRSETTARIDKMTRDFVKSFDMDASGTIGPDEREKLLRTNRASLREQVRKAKMTDQYKLAMNDELKRMAGMSAEDIDQEAINQTNEQIDDYEFAKRNVGSLGGATVGGATGQDDDPVINSYDDAVRLINERITDPAAKARALANAKAMFGVQ